MSEVKEVELSDLATLRERSRRVSDRLRRRLTGHLETLAPLMAPRHLLGEYVESAFRTRVAGADARFATLEERYREIGRRHFGLTDKLGAPLARLRHKPVLRALESRYTLADGGEVTLSSPVRWTLGFDTRYGLSNLLADQVEGVKPDPEALREFVVHSLLMWLVIDNAPGLQRLFSDLGYQVTIDTPPDIGGLPVVVVSANAPAYRPGDAVIAEVVRLSGKPVFEELIDIDRLDESGATSTDA